MPLVYWGTGWFIGIALAAALHLPLEFLLPAFLLPLAGCFLWRHDRRLRLIWISAGFALAGASWFTLHLPHFDQNSLSTYNGIGVVTPDRGRRACASCAARRISLGRAGARDR